MQYSVLKGYLRRVRDYRISLDESIYMTSMSNTNNNNNNVHSSGNSVENEAAKLKIKNTLRDLCDGTNDSDSLACLGYRKYKCIG